MAVLFASLRMGQDMSIRGMGILPMGLQMFPSGTPVPQVLPVAHFRHRNGSAGVSLYRSVLPGKGEKVSYER